MRKAVKPYSGNSCIEIGIGYGSILLDLQARFQEVAGTDIALTEGFKVLQGARIDLVITDRASCFRETSFDLVIMNPPYLRSVSIVDSSIDGGKDGFEVPNLFLQDALRVLRPKGAILILLSSETSKSDFETFCVENNLVIRKVLSKSLFFETLIVYELRKSFDK
jgi:release factor glutamine methyltransferase